MTDQTETHPFTFGCYRAVETPDVEAGTDAPAADESADPTPVTDGGTAIGTTCPACGGDVANVQGVDDCTHCTWTAN